MRQSRLRWTLKSRKETEIVKYVLITALVEIFFSFSYAADITSPISSEVKQTKTQTCDASDPISCNKLALLENKKGSKIEALKLFKLACNGGVAKACNEAGLLEEENENRFEARILLKKSCDAGESTACNNLGLIESGQDSIPEAVQLFKLACDKGNKSACKNLKLAEKKQKPRDKDVLEQDKPGCINAENWPFTIVQKLDDHTYEVEVADVLSSLRMILETKKAIFTNTGHPVGLKVENVFERREYKLTNGFTRSYGVYRECGIVPLPDIIALMPGIAIRKRINGN